MLVLLIALDPVAVGAKDLILLWLRDDGPEVLREVREARAIGAPRSMNVIDLERSPIVKPAANTQVAECREYVPAQLSGAREVARILECTEAFRMALVVAALLFLH
jgi:hypothetical protein